MKNTGEKHHPTVGQKTIPIILNLLKLTCPKNLKGIFYACHFRVSFDQKTYFEKLGILIVIYI
jgi:hypothetical protein